MESNIFAVVNVTGMVDEGFLTPFSLNAIWVILFKLKVNVRTAVSKFEALEHEIVFKFVIVVQVSEPVRVISEGNYIFRTSLFIRGVGDVRVIV